MRRALAVALAAAALAVPAAASAQDDRDTGAPQNPGCFGELVNTGAQAGIAGEFVKANAQRYKDSEESIGNTGVPFLKGLACPGDSRGRDPEFPAP
jgi:hypothetical protein